jgi:hypothetical protein
MHHQVTLSTLCGTLVGILVSLGPDLVHTGILALFGAIVSYLASLGMKWIVAKYKMWRAQH